MIWLHPLAVVGLAALAAPVVVHILTRQQAMQVPFPSLRFIQPRRLASARRRMLEDVPLLAVRAAILALAVVAIAGPFFVTSARIQKWNARTIRADVTGSDLQSGLRRAVAWLDRQPPGRREIVVRSAVPIGALSDVDIAAIPSSIGIRFERSGEPPATHSMPAGPVISAGQIMARELTLDRERTSIRDRGRVGEAVERMEISAPADQQQALNHLRAAVEAERRPVPIGSRRARVILGTAGALSSPLTSAWLADAAARIVREVNPGDASVVPMSLQFGSDGDRLLIWTTTRADDPRAGALLRAVARSLGAPDTRVAAQDEIVPIADARLRGWSREPAPAATPTRQMIDVDDRRWFWALALFLIGLESWFRRGRRRESAASRPQESHAA